MSRPRPTFIPPWVVTLDELETFAESVGVDFLQMLWAWGTVTDIYHLARASGVTVTELTTRLVAAGELGAEQ